MQNKLLLLWCLVVLNLGLQHSSTVEAPSHCSLSWGKLQSQDKWASCDFITPTLKPQQRKMWSISQAHIHIFCWTKEQTDFPSSCVNVGVGYVHMHMCGHLCRNLNPHWVSFLNCSLSLLFKVAYLPKTGLIDSPSLAGQRASGLLLDLSQGCGDRHSTQYPMLCFLLCGFWESELIPSWSRGHTLPSCLLTRAT